MYLWRTLRLINACAVLSNVDASNGLKCLQELAWLKAGIMAGKATQQANTTVKVNQGVTKCCGFCRSDPHDDHALFLINGRNDYRPWIKDLPFGVVLLPNAPYICKKCVRLMQQRHDCKIKMKKLEEILKNRHNGDVTVHSLRPKKQKDQMKRCTQQPPPCGELPNKVVVVAAGPRKASDCISGIYQRPILPKNVQFEALYYGGPSPVYICPGGGGIAVDNAHGVQNYMMVPKNQHIERIAGSENLTVTPDLKETTSGKVMAQERPIVIEKSEKVEMMNVPPINTANLPQSKLVFIPDSKERASGNITVQERPQVIAKSPMVEGVNVLPTSTANLPHDKLVVTPNLTERALSDNIIAQERQQIIVNSKNVEGVNIQSTNTLNFPYDKLVFTSDVKGKTTATIAQEGPQMITKSQNVAKLNIQPTQTPSSLCATFVCTPNKEKTNGHIVVTQSLVPPKNLEQNTLAASAAVKVTGKTITDGRTKEDSNTVVQKSQVVPNSKQITIVPKNSIKQNANKPNGSKGTTTYTFNIDAIKRSLKLSDEKTSKIVVDALKDPALSNAELMKKLNVSSGANVAALRDQSRSPNGKDSERNAPLSSTTPTNQGKCIIIHDKKGNVTSSAHGFTSPVEGDVKKVKGQASVKITIYWTNNTRRKYLPRDLVSIGLMLARGTHKQIALAVWRHEEIRKYFILLLTKNILKEGCGACGLGKRMPKEKGLFSIVINFCNTQSVFSRIKQNICGKKLKIAMTNGLFALNL